MEAVLILLWMATPFCWGVAFGLRIAEHKELRRIEKLIKEKRQGNGNQN